MGDIFNTVFVHPLLNVLVVFYKLFEVAGIPGVLGWSIIAFTCFVRLIMYPVFKQQIMTTKRMSELKPHLDKLHEKHKDDKQKLQQEQLRLYQEAGINPMAGCLLAIVQIPIFIGLYNALNYFVNHGKGAENIKLINDLLYSDALKISTIDTHFLVFNLTSTPSNGGAWYYYLIPVITAVLQYFQAVTSMPAPSPAAVVEEKTGKGGGKKKELAAVEKKPDASDDFQKAMQTQMKYLFPLMIGYFSFTFPVALSIYWNVFSLFSIAQYYMIKDAPKKS